MTFRGLFGCALAALALFACAGPPKLAPTPDMPACRAGFFPEGGWQYVHRLSFSVSGRRAPSLLGVTVVRAEQRGLKVALMTAEGVVLFKAEDGREPRVSRQLPPFDQKGFAEGLLSDVRMLFLPPETAPTAAGRTPEGSLVCRYRLKNGEIVDTALTEGSGREIRRYDAAGGLVRKAVLTPGAPASGAMVLTASGSADYRIEMVAVEAVRLDKND